MDLPCNIHGTSIDQSLQRRSMTTQRRMMQSLALFSLRDLFSLPICFIWLPTFVVADSYKNIYRCSWCCYRLGRPNYVMVLRKIGWCELVVTLAKCCGAKMKRSPYIEVIGGRSVVMTGEIHGRYRITRTSYPSHARSLFADQGTPPLTQELILPLLYPQIALEMVIHWAAITSNRELLQW